MIKNTASCDKWTFCAVRYTLHPTAWKILQQPKDAKIFKRTISICQVSATNGHTSRNLQESVAEGGLMREYLRLAELTCLLGQTLFVHGQLIGNHFHHCGTLEGGNMWKCQSFLHVFSMNSIQCLILDLGLLYWWDRASAILATLVCLNMVEQIFSWSRHLGIE